MDWIWPERLFCERSKLSKFSKLPIPVGIGPESELLNKESCLSFVRLLISGGICPERKLFWSCKEMSSVQFVKKLDRERGSSPEIEFSARAKNARLEQRLSSEGIEEFRRFRELLPRSRNTSLERLLIDDGIEPVRLLLLALKQVRFGNEAKSSALSVPLRLEPGRLISETDPPLLQATPGQLQRWVMLVSDHDLREGGGGGEREFFHLTRACASEVGDAEA
ncbi:hypothetical protein BT93_A0290 [Corymbia citriodora subsp. variegata]|nr:hypothetical protein BT93_A0290 [Corymbia citriodora subsp. variegata]